MINRDIRDKRNKLLNQSKLLKVKMQDSQNFYQFIKTQKIQEKVYKQWKFYDGIIKAFDNLRGVTNV